MGILGKSEVRALYNNIADSYDRWLVGFRLLGLSRWRASLVNQLKLVAGDTVVDLCCGGGQNFAFLQNAVGPDGLIIGVDLSTAMLKNAQDKAESLGISRIRLVESDVAEFAVPEDVNAAISTFGLEMVPDYPDIIRQLSVSLAPDGRLGLLGLKHPEQWPEWTISLGELLVRKFGATRDYRRFKPWQAAQLHMDICSYQEHVAGAVYTSVARPRSDP